uniref:CSON006133 protein n=1 Tax=Culicoides sonorensis TaxID=179676 RepID=A0A336MWY5_CULSO
MINGQNTKFPRYSLDNMPKTSFSCSDKILGGYYADPETQCQMFHVCVKVAGVGIQDYRFLCPNGTAFNQEAQVCADFGDVNCEQDTLFYGSGNFDLYRLGTGFESKRAPYAEEEEAEFHLQRAETSDARRSKQFIVNQSTRSEHPSIQKQHSGHNNNNNYNNAAVQSKASVAPTVKTESPVTFRASPSSFYTPTTTTTTTTSSYNDFFRKSNNNNDYYNSNNDDIFKGSHSSNFFNNRNGKDDLDDYQRSSSSSTTSTTTSTTARPVQTRPRNRGRGHIRARVTAEPYLSSTANSNFYSQPSSTIPPKSRPSPPQISQPNVSVNNRGNSFFNEYDKYSNKLSTNVNKINVEKTSTHLFSTSSPDFQKINNGFGVNSVAPNKQFVSSTSAPFRDVPRTTTPYPNFNSIFNTTLPASSPAPFQKQSAFTNNQNTNQFSSSSTTTTFRPPTPFQVNDLNEQSRGAKGQTRFYNSNYETTGVTGIPTHPTFKARNTLPPNHFNNFAQRAPESTEIPLNEIKPSTYNPGNYHRFATSSTSSSPAAVPEFQPRRFSAPQNFEPTKLTAVTNNNNNNNNNRNNAQIPAHPAVGPSRNTFDAQYHARQLAIAQITITTPAPVTNSNRHQSSNTISTPIYNRPSGREGSRYTPDYSTVSTTTTTTTNKPVQEYQNIRGPQQQQQQKSQVIQQRPIEHQINHNQDPFQTPSSAKKFSTLVPKEHLYSPTTFKPDIFNIRRNYGALEINKQKPKSQPIVVAPVAQQQQQQQQQINVRVSPTPNSNSNNYQRFEQQQQTQTQPTYRPTTTTTATTPKPLGEDEEDDGQYRPELYEKDLYKNKLKAKLRAKQNKHFNYYQTTTSRTNNDEDELFNTAHSQNIAASGNELRAERARQVAANVNKLLDESSSRPSSTTKQTPSKKDDEKDVSYDYQYYDFGNEQNNYDELIEEFGRTKVKSKN